MREISWRVDNINKRKNSDVKLQAKLHNMEFKDRSANIASDKSPEELKMINDATKAFEKRFNKQ